jgi:hypothetical protein
MIKLRQMRQYNGHEKFNKGYKMAGQHLHAHALSAHHRIKLETVVDAITAGQLPVVGVPEKLLKYTPPHRLVVNTGDPAVVNWLAANQPAK